MAYSIYTDHPETASRREDDFNAWSFWAEKNAPWTGVGVPDVAAVLKVVCPRPDMAAVCGKLDFGGHLTPAEAREVLQLAAGAMTDKMRAVFDSAVRAGYGVRVDYSAGAFGAPSASEYLAKSGSA